MLDFGVRTGYTLRAVRRTADKKRKRRLTVMKMLEDKILQCGIVLPGNVLKVDSFLNHQLDVKLINELGKELYSSFLNDNITKILTVEASGIAIACAAAANFDVPVVFAKKGHHENVGNDVYTAEVFLFTR